MKPVEVAAMRMAGRVVEGCSCAARDVAEVAIAAMVRATRREPIMIVAIRSILWKWAECVERRKVIGSKRWKSEWGGSYRTIFGDVLLRSSSSLPGLRTLRKRQVTRTSEMTSTAD